MTTRVLTTRAVGQAMLNSVRLRVGGVLESGAIASLAGAKAGA